MNEKKYSHGGELKNADYKIKYDFSVNINPFGLPENVKHTLMKSLSSFTDYPDPDCRLLRKALAEKEGVTVEQIVCGNGASDIIYRICSSLGIKRALIPAPAFSEYERALKLNGAFAEYLYTKADDSFALTFDSFDAWVSDYEAEHVCDMYDDSFDVNVDAVFLCNPANPSGRLIDPMLTEMVYAWCRKNNAVLIVDECFLGFHEKRNDITAVNLLKKGAPVRGKYEGSASDIIVINAFTKIYSMAGLRLGYAVCSDAETARMLAQSAPHWSVSGPAQTAGIAALQESGYLEKSIKYIKKERGRIVKSLSAMLREKDDAFRVFDSDANYILFTAPARLAESMAEEGIAIRDCNNYACLSERNESFYRIAVRTEAEDDVMLEALRRCLRWL